MNNSREVTAKDIGYFVLLAAILALLVMIAYHIDAQAKMPEITTDKPTEAVTELTTEESPAVEETTEIELTTVKYEDIPELTELGIFKLKAYCGENRPHICNDGDSTETATGTTPKAGRTVAVDPSVIPYGTELYINGNYYIAEDCGGSIKGNVIDIYFDTHEEALNFGVKYAKVFEVGC